MASIFAGASRALLASVAFAFETTLQPLGLLPLLGGCTAAYLVSCVLMRHTIMTEKIARRGVRVPSEYAADYLDQVWAASVATTAVKTLNANDRAASVKEWLTSGAADARYHAFPVVSANGSLVGVVTRHEVLAGDDRAEIERLIARPLVVAFDNSSLREAADLMVREGVGRLPVVSHEQPRRLVGMLTRSDLLSAHARRLDENQRRHAPLTLPFRRAAQRG
jgi:CBS domain-containing protein